MKSYLANEVAENEFEMIEPIKEETYTYDDEGNVVGHTLYDEESGIECTSTYADGRLVRERSEVHTADYTYDADGNMIAYTNIGDHGTDRFTVSYDEQGRRIERLDSSIEELCYTRIYKDDLLIEEVKDDVTSTYYYNDKKELVRWCKIDGIGQFHDCETRDYYDDKGRLITTKTVLTADFPYNEDGGPLESEDDIRTEIEKMEETEYLYEGDDTAFTERREYTCQAETIDSFLNQTDGYKKELLSVTTRINEERVEGETTIRITGLMTNDKPYTKTIYFTRTSDGRLLKELSVLYRPEITVSECTYTYDE